MEFPNSNESVADLPPELQNEIRSQWLSHGMSEEPHALALRERLLNITKGLSFGNVVHANSVASLTAFNRYNILELIYQHLQATGLYSTAQELSQEVAHQFQIRKQPWERTDLMLLASMGTGIKEDVWNLPPDPDYQYVTEDFDEDSFSSPYTEDPNSIWEEYFNIEYNVEFMEDSPKFHFKDIARASLKRLVCDIIVKSNHPIDDNTMKLFFITLQTMTSAQHFLKHLITIYDSNNPKISAEQTQFNQKAVIQIIQTWISFHGAFIGHRTIKLIIQFLSRITTTEGTDEGLRAQSLDILTKIIPNAQEFRVDKTLCEKPAPCIPNPQVLFSPGLTILDPEPLEVARQVTLLAHSSFVEVHSLEFYKALCTSSVTLDSPALLEFFEFGDRFALLALEAFVRATNKASAFNRLIEIGKSLATLRNFDSLSALVAVLRRPDVTAIADITDTQALQEIVNLKHLVCEDSTTSLAEQQREYCQSIQDSFNDHLSAIPNITVELKLISHDIQKMPNYIGNSINWEKRQMIGSKCLQFFNFQRCAYDLYPIPQIQKVINEGSYMTYDQIEQEMKSIHEEK